MKKMPESSREIMEHDTERARNRIPTIKGYIYPNAPHPQIEKLKKEKQNAKCK